jgi:hypothetical protein
MSFLGEFMIIIYILMFLVCFATLLPTCLCLGMGDQKKALLASVLVVELCGIAFSVVGIVSQLHKLLHYYG